MLAVDLNAYIPVGILVLMAIIFVIVNLAATHVLGPKRHGAEAIQRALLHPGHDVPGV